MRDGIKYCEMKLKELRPLAKPLRREHLRQCYVKAEDLKNRKKMVGIKKKMEQEEKRIMVESEQSH